MPQHGDDAEHMNPEGEAAGTAASTRKGDPTTGADPASRGRAHRARGPDRGGRPGPGRGDPQRRRCCRSADRCQAGPPRDEAAELKNDLLRLQAEYVNYRKRVERDRAVAGEMAVIGVLNSLLPVLDDVDAARQHGDLADGPFASIATKLENALKTYGLARIDETGVEFDPTDPRGTHPAAGPGRRGRHRQPGAALGLQVRRPGAARGPGDRRGSGIAIPSSRAVARRWSERSMPAHGLAHSISHNLERRRLG